MYAISAYRHDCGIFVIKHMELWNRAMMRHDIVEGKMNYYRLKVVCKLVIHEAN